MKASLNFVLLLRLVLSCWCEGLAVKQAVPKICGLPYTICCLEAGQLERAL